MRYFDVEEIIFIGSWELWALNFNSSYNQSKPNPSHLYLAASHHATPICKTFPIFHLTIAPPDSNMYSQIPTPTLLYWSHIYLKFFPFPSHNHSSSIPTHPRTPTGKKGNQHCSFISSSILYILSQSKIPINVSPELMSFL